MCEAWAYTEQNLTLCVHTKNKSRELMLGEGNKVSLNSSKQFLFISPCIEDWHLMSCSISWTNSVQSQTFSWFFSLLGLNQPPPSAPTTCGNVKPEEINSGSPGEAAATPHMRSLGFKFSSSPFSSLRGTGGWGKGSLAEQNGLRALLGVRKRSNLGTNLAFSISWAERARAADQDEDCWVFSLTGTWQRLQNPPTPLRCL